MNLGQKLAHAKMALKSIFTHKDEDILFLYAAKDDLEKYMKKLLEEFEKTKDGE